MYQGPKQIIHQKRITDAKYEKMLPIAAIREMWVKIKANQLKPIKMIEIQNTGNTKASRAENTKGPAT